MDIANTTEPNSSQQNYDDFIGGPKTVTITEVRKGTTEQPVELHLAEYPGRPYKPGKSMRRVLIACWGPEATEYAGRRLTLYGDPDVKFGGAAVGGIRIKAMSHLDKPQSINLTVTRGKRAPFVVEPLANAATNHRDALSTAGTLAELQAAWTAVQAAGLSNDADLIARKDARKSELTNG